MNHLASNKSRVESNKNKKEWNKANILILDLN